MSQDARQAEILDLLRVHRSCQISALAKRYDVSEETIRRDIRQLETSGQAYRVRGGVKLTESVHESPYNMRKNLNGVQKRNIALKAAGLVHDGMTVLIDSGTTSYWVARALAPKHNLTVITNALQVAREMTGHRVFLAGGEIDFEYESCFGLETEAFMRRFTPEIAFFSISALDLQRGLLDVHHGEAMLKRALAPLASKVVMLADSSKFERQGFVRALEFDQIDALVTDAPPPPTLLTALNGAGELSIA